MLPRTHQLVYQHASPAESIRIGTWYHINPLSQEACACYQEYRPIFDPAVEPSLSEFIDQHQLIYCPDFAAFVGDKCSHYANQDRSRLYWFHDCCSIGLSYCQLVAVTSWPVVAPKSAAAVKSDEQFIAGLFSEIEKLAAPATY